MKAPVPRPPPPAYGTKSPKALDTVTRCVATLREKVAGRQETVKAEMNGLTPGLDRSPPPRWMGGQGGQSLKVLGRSLSDFGAFLF